MGTVKHERFQRNFNINSASLKKNRCEACISNYKTPQGRSKKEGEKMVLH